MIKKMKKESDQKRQGTVRANHDKLGKTQENVVNSKHSRTTEPTVMNLLKGK